MIIPKLHYISQGNSPKEHIENIQKACTSGVELVQLNLKNISNKKYLKWAKEAQKITVHFQTRLIINGNYEIAKTIKADGVYLEQMDTCPTIVRKFLYSWQLIGVYANTLQNCKDLINKEVDYICLGPYNSETTEKNTPINLGLNGYTAIIDELKTKTPIIGIKGITTNNVSEILETGISGVAVSRAITKDFNSIRLFNELLNASSTKEQRYTFE
ncbi:thiamine-phosphate diphosphorylase [Lutibacter oricola]|uniref:Thiamine-phosphate diphosphorylase n=1 Tax=Lutibacter oricola TaxID=762486 RepID=A0A1H2XGI8_9FLAO|nr:thiamine phosphate synthase [Lutibacter oricola]SDW92023.1 thiamine-phosphate diphosphorylase [Lutibacter oricola]